MNAKNRFFFTMIILIFIAWINPCLLHADITENKKVFWNNLSAENYRQAFDAALELGEKNPIYFEVAYYLQAISFRSKHLLHEVGQAILHAEIDKTSINRIERDMDQFLPNDSAFRFLVRAIIQFNEFNNKTGAEELLQKAMSKKETSLGHYLVYAFTNDIEALSKVYVEGKDKGFVRQQMLIHAYNQGEKGENLRSEMELLLSDDTYYFDKEDYLNFLQMGFGERFVSSIGPGGPNNEPFFGPLCRVTAWDSFKRLAPRHQVLLAFAVGGPGGQNTGHAEELIKIIDEKTLRTYAPIILMLRIYENFHDYRYEEVYQDADELLAMDLDDAFYFIYLYDLAYEYELFFFAGYRAEQRMIDKAVALYEKAYQKVPKWSSFWQECVLQGKGRSQYYAKRYEDSIDTLKAALALRDDPICYIFLCLDYYAIRDKTNGSYWESKARKAFAGNRSILREFEQLLSEVKN